MPNHFLTGEHQRPQVGEGKGHRSSGPGTLQVSGWSTRTLSFPGHTRKRVFPDICFVCHCKILSLNTRTFAVIKVK